MPELRECPFCGGRAKTISGVYPTIDPKIGAITYYYEETGCPACEIWFFSEEDEPEGTSIEKWNRRTGEDG